MKKTLSEKLAENLEYFISKPRRRCIKNGICKYHGKTLGIKTKGCFIGALLPVKSREILDIEHKDEDIISILQYKTLNIKMPKIITQNPSLMRKFQQLHDDNFNWGKVGLSIYGENELKNIIENYNLDKEPFNKLIKNKIMTLPEDPCVITAGDGIVIGKSK